MSQDQTTAVQSDLHADRPPVKGIIHNYAMSFEEVEETCNRFKPHPMNANQQLRAQAIREQAQYLAFCIQGAVPPGREREIAITKIEAASMIAVAGIARESAKKAQV